MFQEQLYNVIPRRNQTRYALTPALSRREREIERDLSADVTDCAAFLYETFSKICLAFLSTQMDPEFVDKMQFYLTALDRKVRQEDENPSIGIILCKEKNRTIVEYALRDSRRPIGVATYEITRTLPKELMGQLPLPEEIAALLEG